MKSRSVALVFLAPVAALAATGTTGLAQTQTTGGLTMEINLPFGENDYRAPESTELDEFFNLARCECAVQTDLHETTFQVEFEVDGFTSDDREARIYVGNNCTNEDADQRICAEVAVINDLSDIEQELTHVVDVQTFMFPGGENCPQEEPSRNIWLLSDDDGDTVFTNNVTSLGEGLSVDTKPPTLPSDITIEPAESGVLIRWDALDADDVRYYQVLCVAAGGSTPVRSDPDQEWYDTATSLCAGQSSITVEGEGALTTLDPAFICGTAAGTAGEIRLDGLENGQSYEFVLVASDWSRNPAVFRLPDTTPTAAIDFWEDYTQYGDAEGGICLVTSTFGDGSPFTRAMRDFRDGTLRQTAFGRWLIEVYYAHIAPLGIYADESLLARAMATVILVPAAGLAALWQYGGPLLTLLLAIGLGLGIGRLWARRVRPALARRKAEARGHALAGSRSAPGRVALAAGAVAALLLPAQSAAAQGFNDDPYFSDFGPMDDAEPLMDERSHWNVALKLGPYVPDIDSQLGDGAPDVYGRMFDGSAIMGIVEIERFFLFPAGQLGAAASVGFTSKSARAYQVANCDAADAPPGCVPGRTPALDENGEPLRAGGDKTGFRMVPASLGIVYRLTALDDLARIPLVPYVKAGLSYYLWWVTQPSGSIAEAPTDECADPEAGMCDGNRALGASIGWQASVGLAVRAERIDPDAAMSLRSQMGIEHAGIYGELQYAKVDGFGAENRLSVGDFTWFAGINFEF